jgi:hypothetical protein
MLAEVTLACVPTVPACTLKNVLKVVVPSLTASRM